MSAAGDEYCLLRTAGPRFAQLVGMPPTSFVRRVAAVTLATVALVPAALTTSAAAASPTPPGTFTGTLADGASWVIRVPDDWNGTLLLYSHGLVPPGQENPAVDSPDPITGGALLDNGYALAGSSFATTGWAIEDALADQLELLDVFADEVGHPSRTVAWGSSLGGLVTGALLERHADRFDGGMAMCGVMAGGIGVWNTYLDSLFTLRTLLAPDAGIDLVDITDPFTDIDTVSQTLATAQQTPAGRARIALAAAVADIPGWIGADNPRPDPDDVATQEAAQLEHFQTIVLFGLALRADVEGRAGGNPSSNIDVDYGGLLRDSSSRREVVDLYRQAGLDVRDDLDTLAAAPRIAADPGAVAYLEQFAVFDGELRDPMLTLHTNGDQLAVVEHEQAYAETVERAGERRLLRQIFTERAGHCTFTPAETLTALGALLDRIDVGRWADRLGADELNDRAVGLGPVLNVHFDDESGGLVPTDPAFDDRRPAAFLRPYDFTE